MKKRMDRDAVVAGGDDSSVEEGLPHWVAQPYVRPLPAVQERVEGEGKISFGYEGLIANIFLPAGASVMASKRPHFERIPEAAEDNGAELVKHYDREQVRPSIVAAA
jgi:hypothetical protein